MRKTSWIALAALFIAPALFCAQQNSQQSAASQTSQSGTASQNSSASTQQEDPLAAAARKAREQRKESPKAAKVFDNDNLPTQGGISTVGEASAPSKSGTSGSTAAAEGAKKMSPAEWRAKFADLRKKLQQDQGELSVMQRELGQQMMQYYNGDPQKAVQDQQSGKPLGEQYDKTKAAIADKQKQVEADQQAISAAEDALRQAGGDPGWAR
jgi:hypothetical protein